LRLDPGYAAADLASRDRGAERRERYWPKQFDVEVSEKLVVLYLGLAEMGE